MVDDVVTGLFDELAVLGALAAAAAIGIPGAQGALDDLASAIERAWDKFFAKGGRQRVGDSGLEDLADGKIAEGARDKSIPKAQRRRFQKEEKWRKQRNKAKRDIFPPIDSFWENYNEKEQGTCN